jgi:hypothetical protein
MKQRLVALGVCIVLAGGLSAGCGGSEHSDYCKKYGGRGEAALDQCERELNGAAGARPDVEREVEEIEEFEKGK